MRRNGGRRSGEAEKRRNGARRKRTWSGVGSGEVELTCAAQNMTENFEATPNGRMEIATSESSRLPFVKLYPVRSSSPLKVTTMLQRIMDGMETPIDEPLIVSWMPKPCLLRTRADTPASSALAGAPELEPKKKRANPNTVLHITKSSTAWNLCAAAYKAEKGKGRLVTSGEYEAYWDTLTAEEKQPWIDKETKGKGKANDRKEDARAVESG
ncbi:hypothetical protein PAXRUDRAFT_17314 [Paxillus rubicundulus Ve08.2h10]|uniref:Uncharacterized protein n=1 Tax=Paxillus rubicundulus Ve08.2h10 TaxID=930991 RepID=A0A0D0CQR2_9AGAM|nr:hypothetical protein PAXRUDRAFT_17314 [Paxillus rubicundulus Ve08.2h10]